MKRKSGISLNDFMLFELRLTDHGYERYLERIGPIERDVLEAWCRSKLAEGEFRYTTTDKLLQLDGVWWNFEINSDNQLILTTTYGKGSYDMVRAIRWEHRQKDLVILKQLV